MKILKIERTETNPFANPATANNGGGYFQPETVVLFDDGSSVDILDKSCGDFGTRIYAVYRDANGEEIGSCNYGSMLRDDEWYSDLRYSDHKEMFDLVEQETGYQLLTDEEWDMLLESGY